MRRAFELGGIAAAVILIAVGIGALVIGASGYSTVHDSIKQENVVGSPDMTPTAIAAEAKKANLPASVDLPTCNIANKAVTNGDQAHCFAQYMRVHALEATGGKTYAEMPRFATADGKGTNDEAAALQKNGRPVDNPARTIWINETALSTALQASYMAEKTATFGVVVGIALLLSGLGFGILALGGALRTGKGPREVLHRKAIKDSAVTTA